MAIALFNPSICSDNLGDEIILESVSRELETLFPDEQVLHFPTQEPVSKRTGRLSNSSRYRFVGGTNLLSSRMLKYRQWKIGIRDTFYLRDIALLGVGWWKYQNKPDVYTRFVLKRTLSRNHLHSVRDAYTKNKLFEIGIENVINTGCPTMWQLTPEHCKSIECDRKNDVVFTVTDYLKAPEQDRKMIAELKKLYKRVFLWPQGSGDSEYVKSLGVNDINLIPPTLKAYDKFLAENNADYIGTRLHGGVRALQKKRRALIVAVDNRAAEIAADTRLAVAKRGDTSFIKAWVETHQKVDIVIDRASISHWKKQFLLNE